MSVPAWQTEELGEEWVEASPSPPGSPEAPPPPAAQNKRGSMRALGTGVARPLPSSRKNSAATNNGTTNRTPSNPYMRSTSGMLSPPTSVSGSEGERDREPVAEDSHSSPVETAVATVAAAGTFLVKEGEDNHGKAFPKNPFQKDIFSALALEKMFEPPSPPPAGSSNAALETVAEASPSTSENERSASGSESAHTTPSSVKFNQSPSPISASPSSEVSSPSSARSSTPGTSSSSHTVSIQRRASHQYAPVNPSRLSKSVTPSDASFATTTEATHESMNESVPAITVDEGTVVANALGDEPSIDTLTDDYGTLDPTEEVVEDEETGTVRGVSSENPSPERELFAEQTSPFTTHSRYPFTFTAPSRQNSSEEPVFDPSLAPLQDGQPSSSTLRNRPPSGGLRLFRSTYDTYTREQLSALVDSIAVQQSPSPPPILPTRAAQWSPADSESPLRSDSSGSASTPASGSSADVRRAKRLRVSPPSPQGRPARAPSVRGPGMIRDWQAHGRALMDRIRVTDPELSASATSASRTDSWGSRDSTPLEDRTRERGTPMSEGISGYNGQPTFEYSAASGRTVEMSPGQFDQLDQLGQPGQQRSNPSTASSTYLNRAQDMMSRIKERNVSPSTSTTANESPRYPRRQLSESSRDTYQSSDAKETMPVTSSRAMVVQPMSSESDMSIEDEGEEADEEETEGEPGQPIRLSGSRTSVEGAGLPGQLQANRDDLNRFMSTSTYTTGTTVSTSFVKHAGPRDAARAPAMTHIAPGDVPPELVQRVGGMRFDRKANRWVRDANGNGSLGRVDEAGESRTNGSDESSDVFAGIDSIHSGERTRGSSVAARSLPRNTLPPVMDELDTTEDDVVEDVDSTPRPPRRPPIAHAYSAPVPKTPNLKPPAGPATPLVLRSALRNANANAAPSSAMKKQAAWHPDLGERSYTKRSVSFSDNYIAPPRGNPSKQASSAEKEDDDDDDEEDGYGQENTNNNRSASWMPSARTKRIQAVLAGMEDMTLADGVADGTPSKASRDQSARQYRALPRAVHSSPSMVTESETNDDDTIEPVPFGASARSFRGAADATFLTECSFGVAHDRLLQVITDVQPFEPYWEQLRTIDLSKKGIDSVVRLKEFLPQLDEANLEDNVISYLSGIPATVRTLHVAGNALSSLTSVNHLRNLQYLDLSRNELDSVSQLECLRHLRELKLDHNVIKDLSGIMSMDSLQRLSAVGNKIEQLDLSTARWEKLESLNLSKNKIRSITGLHRLQSIGSLNLDHNKFTDLDSTVPLERIRSLRFCDNDITYIDLSHFPKLRTLFADNNALPGLSRSMSTGGHRIENLSVRNQRVGHLTLLAEDLQSVKRLYLSGNRLDPDFLPRSPLFHLVYLEAAACNISSWPTNFAQRAPNLRILNVNYNFLTDLDGLSGMVLLRKLMAVGNRLGAGGPAAVRGLGGLTELEEMDMRMNPVTLSFYLPIMMPNADKPPKASGDGGGSGAVPADGNWPSLDAQFRRQLPDEWYSKRLLYRGLVMASCPDLRTLDGIKISDGERRKAAMLLEYAGATA